MSNFNYKNLTPFKWFVLENFPFIEADFDALSEWQLFCKLGNELNKLINSTNTLGTQVENLTNYFDNLDVQEEINNKLNDMAESGELEEIIAQYLQLAGLLCFNTVNDMKNATNLINGSFAKTYGTTSYNDGYGNFYKIREIRNTDVVDGVNIISLTNYNNLIAELMPNRMKNETNSKLTISENHYGPRYNIVGNKYGLSYELFGQNSNTLNHQGVCLNKLTGEIYGNNNDRIFKLSLTKPTTVTTVIGSLNLGHGGDCQIYNNNMYIADSNENEIHVINLSSGVDSVITVPTEEITNPNTNGVPVLGGICLIEGTIYIAVYDSITNDHTVLPTNATIRIYEYINNHFNKIFETESNMVYVQGMTADDDNFYIGGNKVFDSSYTGSRISVISKNNLVLLDVMENSFDGEFEGLDYACINGVEGLLTTINKHGYYSYIGIYSFYGNTTKIYENFDDETGSSLTVTRSHGGTIMVYFDIENWEMEPSVTYTKNNFLSGIGLTGYLKGTSGHPLQFIGCGDSRGDITLCEYVPTVDELRVFPSTNITKIRGCFVMID